MVYRRTPVSLILKMRVGECTDLDDSPQHVSLSSDTIHIYVENWNPLLTSRPQIVPNVNCVTTNFAINAVW
jgi:hypothetical protein